jgi:hypothetical protein
MNNLFNVEDTDERLRREGEEIYKLNKNPHEQFQLNKYNALLPDSALHINFFSMHDPSVTF